MQPAGTLFYVWNLGNLRRQIRARNFLWQMFDSKFHGYQSMKLQLSYEIMFGYVEKLQITHLIQLKAVNIVSNNKFS